MSIRHMGGRYSADITHLPSTSFSRINIQFDQNRVLRVRLRLPSDTIIFNVRSDMESYLFQHDNFKVLHEVPAKPFHHAGILPRLLLPCLPNTTFPIEKDTTVFFGVAPL